MADRILDGKTVLVTGATSGIGRPTALGLATLGARVVVVARDATRGTAVVEELRAAGSPDPALVVADLSSLAAVRDAARRFLDVSERLDVLINNAGAIHQARKESADGHELTFAVNHLAPFALTLLLEPALARAPEPRVVNVASEAHRNGRIALDDLDWQRRRYSGWRAYCDSKLMNLLFTRRLARLWEGRITANALHPGVIASGFGRNDPGIFSFLVKLGAPFLTTPEKGARTSIHVASAPELKGVTGKYFSKSKEARPARSALDDETAAALWRASAGMTGLGA